MLNLLVIVMSSWLCTCFASRLGQASIESLHRTPAKMCTKKGGIRAGDGQRITFGRPLWFLSSILSQPRSSRFRLKVLREVDVRK